MYLFATLLAIFAVLLGILSTPWAQRYFERRMISALEAATGARVEVREFQFRPLILQFVMRGLVVHGEEPTGAPPLFAAKTVTVRLRPRAIIEWKPLLSSVDWDEAEIHISTTADGSANLPALPSQGGAGASVSRLTLSKTSIFWNNERLHVDLNAGDLAILVRRTRAGKYLGNVSADQIHVRGAQRVLPPISLNAQAEFSRAGLETQALSWLCAGISGRGKVSISNWNPLALRSEYEMGGDVQELARILGVREVQAGNMQSQGTLLYSEGKFEARGKLQSREVALQTARGRFNSISAGADFSADSNKISLTDITAAAPEGGLRGSGDISLESAEPEYRFQANVQRLSLRRLLEAAGAPTVRDHVASRASGWLIASWTGRLKNFRSQYKLDFQPDGSERAGVLPVAGTAEGTARLDPALALKIDRADLRTRSSTVSTRGTLGERHTDLELELAVADFEELRPVIESRAQTEQPIPLALKSPATFRGQVSGPLRALEWRGELRSGAFEFSSTRWDSLRAGITLSPDLLLVAAGRLASRESHLRLDASLPLRAGRLDSTRPLRLSAVAEKTRAEDLIAALGESVPLAGSLSGKLDLEGTAEDTRGAGQVRVEDGALYGEPFNTFSAGIRVDRSLWRFNDVVLTKGSGSARGEGEVNFPAKQFRLSLAGGGFPLHEVKRVQSALPDILPSDLQGKIQFDIRAQGWPGDVQMEGTAGILNIQARGMPIGDLTARITRQGRRAELSGRSEGPGGTIQFSGAKQGDDSAPFQVRGDYTAFRLDPWLQLFAGRETAPKLTATGTLEAKLPTEGSGAAEVSAQANQLAIEFPGLAWSAANPVKARYSAGRITVERFRLQGPATNLEVEGSARLDQRESLSFIAEGTAEATLLSLVDPALQASGASTLKVRITGSFARPALHGTVNIQNVNAGYGDLPFRVTGLTGEVVLEGDRATLRGLRGGSGGGRVALTGFVTLGAASRFNIQANLSQVRVRYPSVFTSLLDGTLRLSGSAERGEISGNLIVRQMFPPDNFNWLVHIGQAGSSVGFRHAAIQSPIAPKIRLNIRVRSSPAVRFEARDLRLVGDIDVRLQGTLAEPVEVGHIQILSGEAVFRGNRYAIKRGDISMTNPFRTQTVLTLEAQTRVRRYDLTVNLSGPFDRLKITYRSDPPLPTTDIVTLLAVGYARQQDEMATRTTNTAATVGASAVLSQALSSQMSGRVQRLFGVSRIRIDPNAGGVGATGGALITVEQQVAPELTLTYVTNTGVSQYRVIRLEWAVSDRVSVIGERDQGGIFGMEVQFRQRFR